MPFFRTAAPAALALVAFAANSLLCRLALKSTGLDAAGFTSIRLVFRGDSRQDRGGHFHPAA